MSIFPSFLFNTLALGPIFPYLEAGPYKFGPFTVHMFGLMVGLAIITGMYVTQARAFKVGVNTQYTSELLTWVVIGIFVGSHLFEIIFYQPHRILTDPLVLLRFWDGIASFGGLIGLLATVVIYLRYRKQKLLPYLDVLMWGGVHAWVFGRLGCSYAHDHPGYFTDSWFAVKWPVDHWDQVHNIHNYAGRHDLGLYEFMYTFVILAAFYILNRKGKRFVGFTTALLFTMYAPMRFFLDFLRTADLRYLGLTPAQYLAFVMFVVGVGLFMYLPKDPQPDPVVLLENDDEEEITESGSESDEDSDSEDRPDTREENPVGDETAEDRKSSREEADPPPQKKKNKKNKKAPRPQGA